MHEDTGAFVHFVGRVPPLRLLLPLAAAGGAEVDELRLPVGVDLRVGEVGWRPRGGGAETEDSAWRDPWVPRRLARVPRSAHSPGGGGRAVTEPPLLLHPLFAQPVEEVRLRAVARGLGLGRAELVCHGGERGGEADAGGLGAGGGGLGPAAANAGRGGGSHGEGGEGRV